MSVYQGTGQHEAMLPNAATPGLPRGPDGGPSTSAPQRSPSDPETHRHALSSPEQCLIGAHLNGPLIGHLSLLCIHS